MKIIKCNKLSSARHDYPKAPRIFRHFAAFLYYDCRSFAEYTEVTYIHTGNFAKLEILPK